MTIPHSFPMLWRRGAAAALMTAALMAGGEAALAQPQAPAKGSTVSGVPNAMQGFSQNRDKPIQIDAASLEMRDKDKVATFAGDVKVVQGDTTMRSKSLLVFYDQNKSGTAPKQDPMKAAAPGPGGSSSIHRLEARGNVMVTQKDQTVTGETAVFDTRSNVIIMTGGVVLTQGKNVLRGDRLVVDMTSGVSRVESRGGRVQGLFQSSGEGGGAGPTSILPGSNSPQKRR